MSNCSDYVIADDATTDPVLPEEWNRPDGSEDDQRPTVEAGPSLDEVFREVFDMGVGEQEAYVALAGRDYSSAGELAETLDRDRSNVNRYLNQLYQKGLVTRRRRILQSGGHVYQYSARAPGQVRQLLVAGLREWIAVANDRIERFLSDASADSDRSAPVESFGGSRL